MDTAKEVKKLIDLLAEESEDPDDAEVYALLDQTLQKAEEAFEYGSKEYAKVQELKSRLEVAELMNNATKAYNKTRKVIENAAHYGNDPDIMPSDEMKTRPSQVPKTIRPSEREDTALAEYMSPWSVGERK